MVWTFLNQHCVDWLIICNLKNCTLTAVECYEQSHPILVFIRLHITPSYTLSCNSLDSLGKLTCNSLDSLGIFFHWYGVFLIKNVADIKRTFTFEFKLKISAKIRLFEKSPSWLWKTLAFESAHWIKNREYGRFFKWPYFGL